MPHIANRRRKALLSRLETRQIGREKSLFFPRVDLLNHEIVRCRGRIQLFDWGPQPGVMLPPSPTAAACDPCALRGRLTAGGNQFARERTPGVKPLDLGQVGSDRTVASVDPVEIADIVEAEQGRSSQRLDPDARVKRLPVAVGSETQRVVARKDIQRGFRLDATSSHLQVQCRPHRRLQVTPGRCDKWGYIADGNPALASIQGTRRSGSQDVASGSQTGRSTLLTDLWELAGLPVVMPS